MNKINDKKRNYFCSITKSDQKIKFADNIMYSVLKTGINAR